MKKSRFSDEQIVKILREADKDPVADVAKRHAISEQTIYVWRRRFGEMASSDVKRLKDLEQENARAVGRGISQRRACTLINVSRAMLTYEQRMPAQDAGPAAHMKELSSQYPRYGYRRIQIFLARDGFSMSAARAWRLWSSQGLQLARRRSRKRVATGRPRPLAPTRANQV